MTANVVNSLTTRLEGIGGKMKTGGNRTVPNQLIWTAAQLNVIVGFSNSTRGRNRRHADFTCSLPNSQHFN
jgi:hypothetical protein